MFLNQISDKKIYEQTHVTISISGFLSQETDKERHWQGLVKHLQNHKRGFDANVYSLTWESSTSSALLKTIGKSVGSIAFNGAVTYASGPIGRLGMAMLGAQSVQEMRSTQKLFSETRKKAKEAGKMLACVLALRQPFVA